MPVTRTVRHTPKPQAAELRVTEIFYSLQGEAKHTGVPTAFVRLTGCPLRCGYCDTEYAFSGGLRMLLPEVLERVAAFAPRFVTVTGGEPLAQPGCPGLLRALCDAGYQVSLETGGSLDIAGVDQRVGIVLDLKTPGSGEVSRNLYGNLAHLKPGDEVKFVICDRGDYEWARERIREFGLAGRCNVLLSPAHGQMAPATLAEWILADRLPVRFQIQLHKILWGNARAH
jgi:7-carboxy-7-deazaguanine synthase